MMQSWFEDAKLGIFIHWGIYSVKGIAESWSFFNGQVSYEDYMKQLDGFTASHWNPDEWAELFRRAGAKYAVLTTKHHDGVALWNSSQSNLNVVQRTPAARELLSPFCEAMRRKGLQVGLYFSHLDWSHPDYASIASSDPKANVYAFCKDKTDLIRWEKFLRFHRAQLSELCTQFGEIDLMWFDGDWERDAEQWKMSELRDFLQQLQPNMILNSRMQGYGDYATPEQGLPISPPKGPWEFCMTINDSWGYQPLDTNYKTPEMILRTFCDVISMGGNLLLDVGPREDGTIPPEQVSVLLKLGAWIEANSSAVYGTRSGLPADHFHGPSTQSRDGLTLNLFVLGKQSGELSLRGIHTEIESATMLSSGRNLEFSRKGGAEWMKIPGTIWIKCPEDACSEPVEVIQLKLKEPLKLYRGEGQSES